MGGLLTICPPEGPALSPATSLGRIWLKRACSFIGSNDGRAIDGRVLAPGSRCGDVACVSAPSTAEVGDSDSVRISFIRTSCGMPMIASGDVVRVFGIRASGDRILDLRRPLLGMTKLLYLRAWAVRLARQRICSGLSSPLVGSRRGTGRHHAALSRYWHTTDASRRSVVAHFSRK